LPLVAAIAADRDLGKGGRDPVVADDAIGKDVDEARAVRRRAEKLELVFCGAETDSAKSWSPPSGTQSAASNTAAVAVPVSTSEERTASEATVDWYADDPPDIIMSTCPSFEMVVVAVDAVSAVDVDEDDENDVSCCDEGIPSRVDG
jgi:hypothetical protein